jgi:hypothetical protein
LISGICCPALDFLVVLQYMSFLPPADNLFALMLMAGISTHLPVSQIADRRGDFAEVISGFKFVAIA